jgi:phage shock protein A
MWGTGPHACCTWFTGYEDMRTRLNSLHNEVSRLRKSQHSLEQRVQRELSTANADVSAVRDRLAPMQQEINRLYDQADLAIDLLS